MSPPTGLRSPLSVGSCTVTLPLLEGAHVEQSTGAVVMVAADGLLRLALLPDAAARLGRALIDAAEGGATVRRPAAGP